MVMKVNKSSIQIRFTLSCSRFRFNLTFLLPHHRGSFHSHFLEVLLCARQKRMGVNRINPFEHLMLKAETKSRPPQSRWKAKRSTQPWLILDACIVFIAKPRHRDFPFQSQSNPQSQKKFVLVFLFVCACVGIGIESINERH